MPGVLTQSSASAQYVQVQVTAIQGGSAYDPTGDSVSMAFVPSWSPLSPQSSDWHTGSWTTGPGPAYWAQCLVGSANGGVSLAAGSYSVWVKVTDDPEVPVLPGPLLVITP